MNVYDAISIWFYVRFDYWRNRFWIYHHENVNELIALVPSLEKYRRFLG